MENNVSEISLNKSFYEDDRPLYVKRYIFVYSLFQIIHS